MININPIKQRLLNSIIKVGVIILILNNYEEINKGW